jgi:hypothetical protein
MTRLAIIAALVATGPALAQDLPLSKGSDSPITAVGTFNGIFVFQQPGPPDPHGPITDDFKRGACWAARAAFPGNNSTEITFTGPPMFVCAKDLEPPK